MELNVLQRFLDAGMLDIGEDDEKFKHLQNASQDLAKNLSEKKTQVINHTLVALDPNIPPDEPVLLDAETVIKEHWKTYKNRFPDVSRQLLRAVILEALHTAGIQDSEIASTIWLTGGSLLPFLDLGRERAICLDLLLRMGDEAEKKGVEAWSGGNPDTAFSFPSFSSKLPKLEKPAVDVGELTNHLIAASGPQGKDGQQTGKNHNPHWSNSAPHWSHEFAPRAAAGIAEVLNTSYATLLNSIAKTLKQFDAELDDFSKAFDSAIKQAVCDVAMGTNAIELRNLLLWWKQTLYSPSLRRSYRTLKPPTTAMVMAYDLHHQVPPYCPQSVEYLLRETVAATIKGDDILPFISICETVKSDKDVSEWKQRFDLQKQYHGRTSMLNFVENVFASAAIESERVQRLVGIEPTATIGLEDWSVWLFRDLQARRLALSEE
jgi:hypothetical protein